MMSLVGRSWVVPFILLALAAAEPGRGAESINLDAIFAAPNRTARRTVVAPPAVLNDEELATPLPSPAEKSLPPLKQIRIDTRLPAGPTPSDYASEFFGEKIMADDADRPLRNWAPVPFHWEASGFGGLPTSHWPSRVAD